MVRLRPTALLATLVVSVLCVPMLAASAETSPLMSARYEFGSGQPVDTFDDRGFSVECANVPSLRLGGGTLAMGPVAENIDLPSKDTPLIHAGGACFALPPGTYAVNVVDDLGGEPAFWLGAEEDAIGQTVSLDLGGVASFFTGGETEYYTACDPHVRALGQGLQLFTLEPECARIIVLPVAGSLPGTIQVWSA